jgi:ribonuclease T1
VSSRLRITSALVGLIALVVLGWLATGGSTGAPAPASPATSSGGAGVEAGARPLSGLPPEAEQTWRLIREGGPFRYERDGRTFGNRERLLPARPDGYYREYTVPTPGEGDRGARRFVTGRGGELFYTADHYRSFTAVDPNR